MVDKPKTELDFDNMSDEDFLKLDENDFSGNAPEGETNLTNHVPEEVDEKPTEESNDTVDDDTDSDDSESDDTGDDSDSGSDAEQEEEEEKPKSEIDPHSGDGDPDKKGTTIEEGSDEPKPEEEGKTPSKKVKAETPAKAGYYKLPEGMDTAGVDTAVDFYKKISTPFKADGKDFTVRSPEDAIRLIQQGVNYSRRQQELKPMKQLNRVLEDNGLADQKKISFAIDLMKGDKAAITQLLKSHSIDPMDLDTENDSGYQARNYGGNAQDNDFRDALDETLTTPEGQALVNHINKDWDRVSKAKLREDPSILGNLQSLKQGGVYDKVVEELAYQRSIGYLTNVPFLQAFDQVGEAMKAAGVFESQPQTPAANGNSMASLQSQPQSEPVASGARKSTSVKKDGTNPHLSSTPPSKQVSNRKEPEPDYGKLSDEEFLKMPPPP